MLRKKSTKYNDLLGDVQREVELHRALSMEGHPHIVHLHEVIDDEKSVRRDEVFCEKNIFFFPRASAFCKIDRLRTGWRPASRDFSICFCCFSFLTFFFFFFFFGVFYDFILLHHRTTYT